jgi:Reverse transcriptase (RNA-dependent DNA polymerase)
MPIMQPGRKTVGNTCVYTEKDDLAQRSRTVAQGLSHVPGKYFTGSRAPVMRNLDFGVALIICILMKLHMWQSDAFLYSDLDEEVYMRIPY